MNICKIKHNWKPCIDVMYYYNVYIPGLPEFAKDWGGVMTLYQCGCCGKRKYKLKHPKDESYGKRWMRWGSIPFGQLNEREAIIVESWIDRDDATIIKGINGVFPSWSFNLCRDKNGKPYFTCDAHPPQNVTQEGNVYYLHDKKK